MKILVFSDSHGSKRILKDISNKENADIVIHLGDHFYDAFNIADYCVKGNCDIGEEKTLRILELYGVRILLTHGHKFSVRNSIDILYNYSINNNIDISLFGHNHIIYDKRINGIYFLNPGSISRPRGKEPPSYLLIDLFKTKEEGILESEFYKFKYI